MKGERHMAEVTRPVSLSATRIVLGRTFGEGDRLTYVISLVNSGSAQYMGLRVEDALRFYAAQGHRACLRSYVEGTAEYYVNGVHQAPLAVTERTPLVIAGITVPAGGNAAILYQTDIKACPQESAADEDTADDDAVRICGAGFSIPAVEQRQR